MVKSQTILLWEMLKFSDKKIKGHSQGLEVIKFGMNRNASIITKNIHVNYECLFSHIHRGIHTICPEWPACHQQGGGWQATRPVSRLTWLWRHRQTRRNSNVTRLDSSNFMMFTSEKYPFGTYRRKIINIYCLLVTEKSTNPRVELTCPCLGMDKVNLTLGLVDFSVTTGQ